ncbi:MAG: CDP-6-deoxy-delta-3,4-glucoseen reductase [Thiohalomonadaceae bacterium]
MSFTVRIKPSGHSFVVEPGETVLDAALRQGFAFPYGCRNGCCGACTGKVLSGDIDYGNEEPMALTDEDQRQGKALFCIAHAAGDLVIEVREVGVDKEIPVRVLPAKIHRLERLNDEVMELWLKLPDGERLQFLAGQYVDFVLKDGRHRAFSIANAPHDDEFLKFHIRRIRGGHFTDRLFSDMREKDVLRIEGPKGSFYMREDDRPIIFLATGTGFGPVKAIIEHAIAEGHIVPMYLYWGARHRGDLYMDALARQWAAEYENIHYIPVLSRPTEEDDWTGRTGYVQDAAAADFDDLSGFDVYACGHPQMVFAAKTVLTAKGLDPERCFSDAFSWAKD